MAWPVPQDFNEAVQSPASSFADPELRAGAAVTDALGIPRPCSGNFADVYQVRCPGAAWAVKCFTRQVAGLRERYAAVSDHLGRARLPFGVDFQYVERGIRVGGAWFPVVKMRWVEGLTLNEFVRDNLDKPALLDALGHIWLRMARRLREADVAHGDLQHGNVLLVPGSSAQSLKVKLIDYDGMFVPALAGKPSGEVGHPNYQHPQRLRQGGYGPEVDRFGLLVVATALRCLQAAGRPLWERYDNGDNLLFTEADFANPHQSPLFAELLQLQDSAARVAAARLMAAAQKPLEQTPLLEEVFPEKSAAAAPPPLPAPARPAGAGSSFALTPRRQTAAGGRRAAGRIRPCRWCSAWGSPLRWVGGWLSGRCGRGKRPSPRATIKRTRQQPRPDPSTPARRPTRASSRVVNPRTPGPRRQSGPCSCRRRAGPSRPTRPPCAGWPCRPTPAKF
jgi:hypothetical protein